MLLYIAQNMRLSIRLISVDKELIFKDFHDTFDDVTEMVLVARGFTS